MNKNAVCSSEIDLGEGYYLKSKEGKEVIIKQGTIYIFDWENYFIVGNKEFTLKLFDEVIKAKKIKEDFVAEFQIKNHLGVTRLKIFDENGHYVLEKQIEVLSNKVCKIMEVDCLDFNKMLEAHRKFLQILLQDILRISSSLPFYIESPTAFGVVEGNEPINELFAYFYLRNLGENIKESFETVLRKIKKKLVEEYEWIGVEYVDEISPDSLISIPQHPEYMIHAESNLPIAQYLNGYVPTKILSLKKYESFDTPENRFAKYFLDLLLRWAEKVIDAFCNQINLEDIEEIYKELEFLRRNAIWDEVGDMTIFPYNSQTLLKGDGYRDLVELYRKFTSYIPFFDEFWKVIENKDIAKLYEYWAFFKIVEKLGEILGKKSLKISILYTGEIVEGYVCAEFNNSWKLWYNKKKKGYSVSLKPDFLLSKNNEIIGVFDAKFKFDIVNPEIFLEEDEKMEEAPNIQTWAKLEDIYKMHTYRDALKAKFAVVIYPGNRSVFFNVSGEKKGEKEWKIEDLISNEGVTIEGVGYMRMAPMEVKR